MQPINSFVFYRSFYESLQDLDDKSRLQLYDAICSYSLDNKMADLKGINATIFKLIKPQIDSNNKRRADGNKGGRPKTTGFEEEKPLDCNNGNHSLSEKKPNVNGNEDDNGNEDEEKNEELPKVDLISKKEKPFDFKNKLLELLQDKQLVSDFLIVRKNKRLSNTETAFNGLIEEIGKSKLSVKEAIKLCVKRSWGGFDAKWLENAGIAQSTAQDEKDDKKAKEIEKLRSLGWTEENIKLATENNNW